MDNVNTIMPLNCVNVLAVMPILLCLCFGDAIKERAKKSVNIIQIHIAVGFFLNNVSIRLYAPKTIKAKSDTCDIMLPDGYNTPCR